jgi:4-hydroxybenzoate polyprenyltransferase
MAFYVPLPYFKFIGVLLVMTLVHFIINYLMPSRVKQLLFLKEAFIAFIVTLGFAYTPFLEVADKWSFGDIQPYLCFLFFMNFANLILFSYFDKDADRETNTMSIAEFYSDYTLKIFITVSLLVSLYFAWVLYFCLAVSLVAFITMLVMLMTLFIISRFSSYFSKNDRYRFYGDLIYVYPLAVMPFL